jgi:hypothetical protein
MRYSLELLCRAQRQPFAALRDRIEAMPRLTEAEFAHRQGIDAAFVLALGRRAFKEGNGVGMGKPAYDSIMRTTGELMRMASGASAHAG